MKKLIAILALFAVMTTLSACKPSQKEIERAERQARMDAAFKKTEQDWSAYDAQQQGDTYCKNCDKVNPGRVRICKYCGQYIR